MARTNGNIYRDYRKGKKVKTRRFSLSFLLFVLDIIMFVALLLLAAATIICVITPKVTPEQLGLLSTVVLGAPIIYMVLLIVSLYWVLRWKWSIVIFSLIFVIIGSLSVKRYYRIDFKQKPQTNIKNCTKVVCYNIANNDSDSIVSALKAHNPNILCLQEYVSASKERWNELGEKYTSTANGSLDFSCEIFTKYRILKQGLIDSLPRFNAIWADLLISKDTVRVINLHLKSTTITAQDMQFVEGHEYVLDTARNSKLKSIADKLAENNIFRSAQAKKVEEFIIASQPRKMIVCGDFNDVPLSYSYNLIAQSLVDTFIAAGSGYTYTFNGFFKLLAIDHMLTTEHFDILSYEVDYSMNYSDHYPIISRLKLKQDKKKQ